jgi:DNA invertase Pin-like site-specific DNA recombinase
MTRAAIAYMRVPESSEATDEVARFGGELLDVVAVVRDERGRRDGLAKALERIAAGEASTLVVARLAELAGSLRELVALLDWLGAARVDLVAPDVDLDTGTAAGRRIVGVLREIERWGREPEAGRPPRGRPGLAAQAPELSDRITAMREDGLSLQAIADALNADGIPTQRGGAHWRPSSVQVALGYRRPRPPAPGAPPPPPHPGRHPHASHPPGGPRRQHNGPNRP